MKANYLDQKYIKITRVVIKPINKVGLVKSSQIKLPLQL